MMCKSQNKIESHNHSVSETLDYQNFTVDYFHSEYKWEEKHIGKAVFIFTSYILNEYHTSNKNKKEVTFLKQLLKSGYASKLSV